MKKAGDAHYPVSLDLSGARILLLGAGAVALQKLKGLPRLTGGVRIIAPEISPGVLAWAKKHKAEIRRRRILAEDLRGRRLVFCCASDEADNARAAAMAHKAGAWVCQAADPSQGDLQVPAIARAAGLIITLSTGGASPALAKALRRRLELQFRGSDLAFVLAQLRRRRPALKADPAAKARLLKAIQKKAFLDAILAPRSPKRRAIIKKLLLA